jgi:hypothetical protein
MLNMLFNDVFIVIANIFCRGNAKIKCDAEHTKSIKTVKPSVLAGKPVIKSNCNNSPVAVCVIERLYSLNFLIPELLCKKQGKQLLTDSSRRSLIPGV